MTTATRDRSRRRRLSLILPVLVFALAACGGENEDQGPNSPNPSPTASGSQPASEAGPPSGHPAMDVPSASPETVVLTVNGEPVTQGRLDEEIRRMVFRGQPIPPQQLPMIRQRFAKQAADSVVDAMLLEAAAEQNGVAVSAEDLAARWKEIDDGLPPGSSRAAILAQQGMTQEQANGELTKVLKFEKLLEAKAPPPAVTDEAVKQEYDAHTKRYETPERVQARHILIKVDPKASEEEKAAARAKLEDIRAQATKEGGKSFEDLAREHSACPSSAQGGDLGLFGRGRMVPEFDTRAFELEPGVVSEPFLTQFGYHILRVEKKLPGGLQPFDEVKAAIKAEMLKKGRRDAEMAYIASLRAAATIEERTAK